MSAQSLTHKMRSFAATSPLETVKEKLIKLADDLDREIESMGNAEGVFDVRRLLGAWAKARMYYCSVSGEPLV